MRVAMIGQKGIPATYGGIERHVDEIARRLVQRGISVDVFCRLYYTPPDSEYHHIGLLRRPSIHTKHLDTATHVTWATLESMCRNYDVVHFHALGPALFSSLPRLTGSRTVVTVHGLDWQREKWGRFASWVLRRCEGPAAHFPNRTIVVSKTLREHFRAAHGIEAEYIPNGTLLPQPRPPRKLASLGLEPGKYVLFVGRLVPEKGVHFLCEAFSKIPTDMKLALVGGLSFSQDYVSLLKRYESDRIRLLDYVFGERSRSCGAMRTASCSRPPWRGCPSRSWKRSPTAAACWSRISPRTWRWPRSARCRSSRATWKTFAASSST